MRTSFRPSRPLGERLLPIVGIAILTAPFASGCELFVHFDRSRINADSGVDGGPIDANRPMGDGGHDGAIDSSLDSSIDAFVPSDVGNDAFHFDTGTDAGCQGISDCPVPPDCVAATCIAGLCGVMNLDATHDSATQTAHDCQRNVCNGTGGSMVVADAADAPSATECDTPSCSGTTIMHNFELTTHACTTGGSFCDGAGNCVQCNTAAQCTIASCAGASFTPAQTCNGSHMCVSGTPVDCGATSQVCNASAGCVQCNSAAECAPASCAGAVFTPAQTCTGAHACMSGSTTDCSATSRVCNMAAGCVQCNGDPDCVAIGMTTCALATHTCS